MDRRHQRNPPSPPVLLPRPRSAHFARRSSFRPTSQKGICYQAKTEFAMGCRLSFSFLVWLYRTQNDIVFSPETKGIDFPFIITKVRPFANENTNALFHCGQKCKEKYSQQPNRRKRTGTWFADTGCCVPLNRCERTFTFWRKFKVKENFVWWVESICKPPYSNWKSSG